MTDRISPYPDNHTPPSISEHMETLAALLDQGDTIVFLDSKLIIERLQRETESLRHEVWTLQERLRSEAEYRHRLEVRMKDLESRAGLHPS